MEPTRILVIDDDPSTAEVIRGWYKEEPYTIDSAETGELGLVAVTENAPDLILLDIGMPGIDGIEVAQRLKSAPETQLIPIILLTAYRDGDYKARAFEAGVDGYVTKPFEFAEVGARIKSQLTTRARTRALQSTVYTLESTNSQLEELLIIDEKTGLYNFRHFQRKLKEEWSRHERYGTALSLVLFDLDDFKKVNDTLGHLAGDRALQEFATLTMGGARSTDISARYGGEEFAVILPHTDGPMALRVAERIRAAVADYNFLDQDKPHRMTVSAGIATVPAADIDSIESLIRASDRALYIAKDQGKNRVVTDPGAAHALADKPSDARAERAANISRKAAERRRAEFQASEKK